MSDSWDDTDVSSMVAVGEKGQEFQIADRQTKPGDFLYILYENDNELDGRSMNVVMS